MSFLRAHTPLRQSLRRWVNVPLTRLFARDPLFTSVAPIGNPELARFVRNAFPRAELKEGPTSFRLEAEVPGFRKQDLSITFVNDHAIRISGTQRLIEAETDQSTDGVRHVSNVVEDTINDAKQTVKSPPTEGEYESYVINPSDAEEDYQIIGMDREFDSSFSRHYELPEKVNREAVKAKLDHGILTVILPKLHTGPPQSIRID